MQHLTDFSQKIFPKFFIFNDMIWCSKNIYNKIILQNRRNHTYQVKNTHTHTHIKKKEGKNRHVTYFIFIHQEICSFQISMNYVILMQVVHSLGNIYCNLQQGWELKNTLLFMQVVINTSTRHKFCNKDEK